MNDHTDDKPAGGMPGSVHELCELSVMFEMAHAPRHRDLRTHLGSACKALLNCPFDDYTRGTITLMQELLARPLEKDQPYILSALLQNTVGNFFAETPYGEKAKEALRNYLFLID